MSYSSVAQVQARLPHVARHSVFSGPRKHSEKYSNLNFVEKRVKLHLSR